MHPLTERQRQILTFIQSRQESEGNAPTLREIAEHFGFQSMNAALAHVNALRKKGVLTSSPRRARSLKILVSSKPHRRDVVEVPLFGSIPAGFAQEKRQEPTGFLALDAEALGVRPGARTFALEVRGDSMIGKHIADGDFVILEHGVTPRSGDVVAALIDNESTLKTFVLERGRPLLRAENPKYPKLVPVEELVIQGVMVALIRRRKPKG